MVQFTTLVCLAHSHKHGGACVAGKVWHRGCPGAWIRPVGDVSGSAIMAPTGLRVLDLVDVPLIEPVPLDHQQENHRLAFDAGWHYRGRLPWRRIDACLDPPQPLWQNGLHSSCGHNDRVLPGSATTSLRLIRVRRLELVVTCDSKLRGRFRYLDHDYDLAVTDLWLGPLRHKPSTVYPLRDVVLCISLGEIFQGYCYKLIASVLYERRFS